MSFERVLVSFGASQGDLETLRGYCDNRFSGLDVAVPLPDEPHVALWRAWMQEGERDGVFVALRRHLPQLCFPVAAGMSQASGYRRAVLGGEPPDGMDEATGLVLAHPEALRLSMVETAAGTVPVLLPLGRDDFESLVRALAGRNEPVPLLASMGACTVKGFNDWERIRAWQAEWLATHADGDWAEEFARLRTQPERYQDRFLILSDGPYSDIPASWMGLSEDVWRAQSAQIRTLHECTHYVTLRLFASSRNNAHDELVCDFVGFSSVLGRFRAAPFLHGMGVDGASDAPASSPAAFREGGRLRQYAPDLDASAFTVLCALVRAAAGALEAFDAERERADDQMRDQVAVIAALCATSLVEMADDDGVSRLLRAFEAAASKVAPR